MLSTPYFIIENNCKIEDLYTNKDDIFIKVYLPCSITNVPKGGETAIVDNYIVKAILEKYPNKQEFFKSISFDENSKGWDWDNQAYFSFNSLYKDIQEEFINIDILIMDYDRLDLNIRKYVNNLLRCNCVCTNGKLLFHIISNVRYFDLRKQGYIFETYCDKEILMLGHEIQLLQTHNGIVIDDYYNKKHERKYNLKKNKGYYIHNIKIAR